MGENELDPEDANRLWQAETDSQVSGNLLLPLIWEMMNQIEEMQTDFDKLRQTLWSLIMMLLPLIWEKMTQIEDMLTDFEKLSQTLRSV
jgi:hypothetical protein